jgi:hypothetical protein
MNSFTEDNLKRKTVKQLRRIIKRENLFSNYSTMKKSILLDRIMATEWFLTQATDLELSRLEKEEKEKRERKEKKDEVVDKKANEKANEKVDEKVDDKKVVVDIVDKVDNEVDNDVVDDVVDVVVDEKVDNYSDDEKMEYSKPLLYFSDGRVKIGQSILMAYTGNNIDVNVPYVVAKIAVNSDHMCEDFKMALINMLEKNTSNGEKFQKALINKIRFLIGV